jgi:hypothetical protein
MTDIKVKIVEAIPAGRYPCVLEEVKNITEKGYQSEEMEERIRFTFKVKVKNSVREFIYKCSPTVSPKSNLSKITDAMHPDGAVPLEAKRDENLFATELAKMIGKKYQIQIGINEKGYNVYGGIVPLEQASKDVSTDEIPF